MSTIYNLANSSIHEMILQSAEVFFEVLQSLMTNWSPNRIVRDAMRATFLPQLLKGFGIFGSVDTTKIQNYNSEDHDISELHYEPHKGMGMKALVITDLTGEPIYCDFNLNGAAYDGNQVLV